MVRFPGGDPFLAENTFGAVLRHQRFAVVVVTGDHTPAHHIVCGLNTPDALLAAVTHPGLAAQWQREAKFILLLAVLKNYHILFKTAVHFITPVNTDFSQQALNKFKVSFPPLGDELPSRVLP